MNTNYDYATLQANLNTISNEFKDLSIRAKKLVKESNELVLLTKNIIGGLTK